MIPPTTSRKTKSPRGEMAGIESPPEPMLGMDEDPPQFENGLKFILVRLAAR